MDFREVRSDERNRHRLMAMAGGVLSCVALMTAVPRAATLDPDVVVGLSADERVPLSVVTEATETAAQIYSRAGVTMRFVPPAQMPSGGRLCRRQVRIALTARGLWSAVGAGRAMGVAARSDAERGVVAYIFLDIVAQTAGQRSIPIGTLMAYAIAHELGHTLLPNGHGKSGVMRDSWDARDFELIRHRELRLGDRETSLIRAYLISSAEVR